MSNVFETTITVDLMCAVLLDSHAHRNRLAPSPPVFERGKRFKKAHAGTAPAHGSDPDITNGRSYGSARI